ncbi:MAG TPA: GTP-binding protein [Planctomycetota bacterium]
MATAHADPRCPVTILTGWLGSGKTTLLNRLLAEPGGRRFAVLVNEFGDLGVDQRLVTHATEDLIELANGCVCCTVRGDLVAALRRLHRRRSGGLLRRPRPFDAVLLETTGIAEPAPLLRTFLVEAGISALYRVAAVIALVDARHAELALAERAAAEQIAVADLVVLNKTDLAGAAALADLETRLRALNPAAPVRRAVQAALPVEDVLAERPPRAPDSLPEHAGHEHGGIAAVALREAAPLEEMKVELWLRSCLRLQGAELIRYKGFLNLRGRAERVVLQGVYELFQADAGAPWGSDPRATELVFIGRGLDAALLRRGLDACRA